MTDTDKTKEMQADEPPYFKIAKILLRHIEEEGARMSNAFEDFSIEAPVLCDKVLHVANLVELVAADPEILNFVNGKFKYYNIAKYGSSKIMMNMPDNVKLVIEVVLKFGEAFHYKYQVYKNHELGVQFEKIVGEGSEVYGFLAQNSEG